MKWYNYGDKWVNLDKVNSISVEKQKYPNQEDGLNVFFEFSQKRVVLRFTPNESEEEYEKIKRMMGISKKDDWTPGRCC